jgi:hypothetical protein
MNGKILASVGFSKTEGVVRQLTIGEQLTQIVMSKANGTINHPVHGKIDVPIGNAIKLYETQEESLFRYKKSMFYGSI